MEDHTDYIEFMRPEGKKVRIVFELFRGEVLFYHYEYQHDIHSEWKPMVKNAEQTFAYALRGDDGSESMHQIAFPSLSEMKYAHETVAKRNYGHSI